MDGMLNGLVGCMMDGLMKMASWPDRLMFRN